MAGPTKHNYGDTLGTVTQLNFDFLKRLWDPALGPQLRKDLFSFPPDKEQELRDMLADFGIVVAPTVHVMIVDIENASVKSYVTAPSTEDFYVLVLPPAPRRHTDQPGYRKMQQWLAANYHAINDSYGM